MAAERTIGEAFQSAEAQPGVGGIAGQKSRHVGAASVPVDQRQAGEDAAGEFALGAKLLEQRPLAPVGVAPVGHVMHRGDALSRRFGQGKTQGRSAVGLAGLWHDCFHQANRRVF